MKALIFGATGMVGKGVLLECLDDERVERVLVVSRHRGDVSHPKLRELLHDDFFNFQGIQSEFAGYDACFFCLGVSSVGMKESDYRRMTYDLTLAAATAIAAATAGRLTFCYVSGEGTDSTERGRTMWARVKGRTENALLAMFKRAYMFRPGYIQPVGDVRSKTAWVQAALTVMAPLYPVLRPLLRGTTTANFGKALIEVSITGYTKRILYSRDINALAVARETGA